MPKYVISRRAQSDLRAIVRYTLETWGHEQTVRYIRGLHSAFDLLGRNSSLGRECDEISPGLRRHERGRHVIFYRVTETGIRVSRVLHQQMIPVKALFEARNAT